MLKVVLEGMGALFGHPLPKKLTILGFGNGTTLYSRYNRGKLQFAIRNSQFAIRNSQFSVSSEHTTDLRSLIQRISGGL
ncbi:MAG: hypothetical protein ACYTXE_46525, partial [Nostoc sp.]